MRSRRRKRVITPPEIMLSPMIDMIFLLLVFFIVSTMYMSEIKTETLNIYEVSSTLSDIIQARNDNHKGC